MLRKLNETRLLCGLHVHHSGDPALEICGDKCPVYSLLTPQLIMHRADFAKKWKCIVTKNKLQMWVLNTKKMIYTSLKDPNLVRAPSFRYVPIISDTVRGSQTLFYFYSLWMVSKSESVSHWLTFSLCVCLRAVCGKSTKFPLRHSVCSSGALMTSFTFLCAKKAILHQKLQHQYFHHHSPENLDFIPLYWTHLHRRVRER